MGSDTAALPQKLAATTPPRDGSEPAPTVVVPKGQGPKPAKAQTRAVVTELAQKIDLFGHFTCAHDVSTQAGVCAAVAPTGLGATSLMAAAMRLPGATATGVATGPTRTAARTVEPDQLADARASIMPTVAPPASPGATGAGVALATPVTTDPALTGATAANPITREMLARGASSNTANLVRAGVVVAPMYVPDGPDGKQQVADYLLRERFSKPDFTAALRAYNAAHPNDPPRTSQQFAQAYAELAWQAAAGPIQGNMRTVPILDEGAAIDMAAPAAAAAGAQNSGQVAGMPAAQAAELQASVLRSVQTINNRSDRAISAREASAAVSLTQHGVRVGGQSRFSPPPQTRRVDPNAYASADTNTVDVPSSMPTFTPASVSAAEDQRARDELQRQFAVRSLVPPGQVATYMALAGARATEIQTRDHVRQEAKSDYARASFADRGVAPGTLDGVAV